MGGVFAIAAAAAVAGCVFAVVVGGDDIDGGGCAGDGSGVLSLQKII